MSISFFFTRIYSKISILFLQICQYCFFSSKEYFSKSFIFSQIHSAEWKAPKTYHKMYDWFIQRSRCIFTRCHVIYNSTKPFYQTLVHMGSDLSVLMSVCFSVCLQLHHCNVFSHHLKNKTKTPHLGGYGKMHFLYSRMQGDDFA